MTDKKVKDYLVGHKFCAVNQDHIDIELSAYKPEINLQSVIDVQGPLNPDDYYALQTQISNQLADDSVSAIIMRIESPGGSIQGVKELGEFIRSAQVEKPIYAISTKYAFSAAYWIASQATEFIVTPSAELGSIGVIMLHTSMQGALEMAGIKPTFIQAGNHKTQGNPYRDLSDEDVKKFQAKVDDDYVDFVEQVELGRLGKISSDSLVDTQADTYSAQKAKDIGLVDRVVPFGKIPFLINELKEINMSESIEASSTNLLTQEDVDNARVQEKARSLAIVNAGRGKPQATIAALIESGIESAAAEAILASMPDQTPVVAETQQPVVAKDFLGEGAGIAAVAPVSLAENMTEDQIKSASFKNDVSRVLGGGI